MSLETTELFSGTKTKRLVVSYKEGSDFDLVLQQLQKNRKAGKTNQALSHLIRTLVIATNGCDVFKHHPDVDSVSYERFCLEALGLLSGYCSMVKGYLSLERATDIFDDKERIVSNNNDEMTFTKLDSPSDNDLSDDSPSDDDKNTTDPETERADLLRFMF